MKEIVFSFAGETREYHWATVIKDEQAFRLVNVMNLKAKVRTSTEGRDFIKYSCKNISAVPEGEVPVRVGAAEREITKQEAPYWILVNMIIDVANKKVSFSSRVADKGERDVSTEYRDKKLTRILANVYVNSEVLDEAAFYDDKEMIRQLGRQGILETWKKIPAMKQVKAEEVISWLT